MLRHVPNILTVFRITLVPVFLYLVMKDMLFWATFVFAIAGITDAIDGQMAKRMKLQSVFGSVADPIADKILLSSSFIVLAIKGYVPLWLTLTVVVRDIDMLFVGVSMLKRCGKKIAFSPTFLGKLSTDMQIASVLYTMVIGDLLTDYLMQTLWIATAAVSIISGLDYTIKEIKTRSSGAVIRED